MDYSSNPNCHSPNHATWGSSIFVSNNSNNNQDAQPTPTQSGFSYNSTHSHSHYRSHRNNLPAHRPQLSSSSPSSFSRNPGKSSSRLSRLSRSSASKSKTRHFRKEHNHQQPARRKHASPKEQKTETREKPHEKDVAVSDSSSLSGRISVSHCDGSYSKQNQEDLKMNDENNEQRPTDHQYQVEHPLSDPTENVALSRNNGNVGSYMNTDSTDTEHEDVRENHENDTSNANYYLYQFPLTDDSTISDKEDEDEKAQHTHRNNQCALKRQQRKLVKIQSGSKSCCEQPYAMRKQTKPDRDRSQIQNANGNGSYESTAATPVGCVNCSSYKSEINYLRGIAVSNLDMNKLMELEKELITSLSRVQNGINDKYKNEKLCIVCMVAQKCVVYQPCGHFSTCFACSKQLEKCPICMQTICDKFRIYH